MVFCTPSNGLVKKIEYCEPDAKTKELFKKILKAGFKTGVYIKKNKDINPALSRLHMDDYENIAKKEIDKANLGAMQKDIAHELISLSYNEGLEFSGTFSFDYNRILRLLV